MSMAQLPSHDQLRYLGAAMLPLAERFQDFVHRRVTTFELEQAEFARVRESVDFTLDRATLDALTCPDIGTFIPFGWLARGPLTGFDLRHGGNAVSMLSADQLLQVTQGMVGAATASTDEDFRGALSGLVEGVDAVGSHRTLRTAAIEDFETARRDELPPDWPRVRALLRLLAVSFLSVAVLPERPKGRTIIKYSYETALKIKPRFGRYSPVLPVPSALLSSTHHVDVKFPAELRAVSAVRKDIGKDPAVPILQEPSGDERPNVDRVAFYTRREDIVGTDPAVALQLSLEPGAFPGPALVTGAALLVLLALGWFRDPAQLPSTATAILLATSGALTTLAQRAPASPLVQRLVVAPRATLVVAGLSVLAAGAGVAMSTGADVRRAIWLVALLVTLFSVYLLSLMTAVAVRRTADGRWPEAPAQRLGWGVGALAGLTIMLVAFNPWGGFPPTTLAVVVWSAAAVGLIFYSGRQFRKALADQPPDEDPDRDPPSEEAVPV